MAVERDQRDRRSAKAARQVGFGEESGSSQVTGGKETRLQVSWALLLLSARPRHGPGRGGFAAAASLLEK